jgi:hypothetical protein
MQLPETTNASHIYAFKKGYRLAMEGKPQSFMPSQIRHDAKMREYFQMGWDQFQQELANGAEEENKAPWRSRMAWLFMAIIAGLGTASLMVAEMQTDKEATLKAAKATTPEAKKTVEQPALENPTSSTSSPHLTLSAANPVSTASIPSPKRSKDLQSSENIVNAKNNPPPIKETPPSSNSPGNELRLLPDDAQTENANSVDMPAQPPLEQVAAVQPVTEVQTSSRAEDTTTLRLLSPDAHADLKALKEQTKAAENLYALAPLHDSPIKVERAQFTTAIHNKQPVDALPNPVPKYIRKIYLFTEVVGAEGKTIYHRWIYQNKIMAEVPLKIKSNRFRTWSSKRMTSAWKGRWTVEVLNEDKQPIARHHFDYIQATTPQATKSDSP